MILSFLKSEGNSIEHFKLSFCLNLNIWLHNRNLYSVVFSSVVFCDCQLPLFRTFYGRGPWFYWWIHFLTNLGKKQMGNNEALKTLWVYIKKHKLQGKLKYFKNLMKIILFFNILISRNFSFNFFFKLQTQIKRPWSSAMKN